MDTKSGRRRGSNLSFFYRVFCWCSGARLYLLEKCPSDLNKYLGIGAIIFMTGIMASLSGGYAIFTIFKSYPVAILFGLLWGVLIFFMDFFLVSSLKKQERIKLELPFAIPRFVLALLIAIVISKPIELKLFQREINVEIATMQSQKNLDFSKIVGKEFEELDLLQAENDKLQKEILEKESIRNNLFNLVIAEAEGQSPTNRVGKGPVYAEKRQEFNAADKVLSETKIRNFKKIEANSLRIADLKSSRDLRKKATAEVNSESDGFLARMEAMSNLKSNSFIVSLTSLFITLLFIVIESSPIIVKLLSRKGPYDYLLEAEEFSKEAEASMIIENIRFGHEDSIDVDREIARIKFKSEISLQSDFISEEAQVRRELFKRRMKAVGEKGKLPNRDLKLVTADSELSAEKLEGNEESEATEKPKEVTDIAENPTAAVNENDVSAANVKDIQPEGVKPSHEHIVEESDLVLDEKKMSKN